MDVEHDVTLTNDNCSPVCLKDKSESVTSDVQVEVVNIFLDLSLVSLKHDFSQFSMIFHFFGPNFILLYFSFLF